jgi:AcrR family transcriptional regulator
LTKEEETHKLNGIQDEIQYGIQNETKQVNRYREKAMGEKDTSKQKMVEVTIQFICQGKKPSEITVADITEKAGVGNGMVNYHFQSKDNLMRAAVKKVMECAKKTLSDKVKAYETESSKERMAIILKEALDVVAQNPEICKIAILDHLENDNGASRLLGGVEVFEDCLRELCADQKEQTTQTCQMWTKHYIITSFLNYIFLKAEAIKKETGFDFYDKIQRDEAAENLMKELF